MNVPHATMDFFGQQDRTRRRTLGLCALMVMGVLAIVGGVCLAYALIAAYPRDTTPRPTLLDPANPEARERTRQIAEAQRTGNVARLRELMETADPLMMRTPDPPPYWRRVLKQLRHWPAMVSIAGATLAFVVGAAVVRSAKLAREGGAGIAIMLGGEALEPDTNDPDERKLLNIVNEMAIASGMPVPAIYVLNKEEAINAFAAGFTTEDAVIGVTRGAIAHLDRDELQGVIAHEFSHILNGDMRLNVRLIGIIFGLVVLAHFGMRMIAGAGRSRTRRGKGGGAAALLGLAVMLLGLVGMIVGEIIRAAVSRQREFLADAAAVQFTRNPQGLARALKKIGGFERRAHLNSDRAEEASHMFFGQPLETLDHTHPPLDERIRAIEPDWDGQYITPDSRRHECASDETANEVDKTGSQASDASLQDHTDVAPMTDLAVTDAVVAGGAAALSDRMAAARQAAKWQQHFNEKVRTALEQIGEPTAAHLAYAHKLREAIPDELLAAAQRASGGRAVIHAMLLHADAAVRRHQMQRLESHAEPMVYELTRRLAPMIDALGDDVRLILIDLALPRLRKLTPKQFAVFHKNMNHLIRADQHVSLFEWMMRRVVLHDLERHILGTPRPRARYHSLRTLGGPVGCLLSTLSYFGAQDTEQAQQMYAIGAAALDMAPPPMWAKEDCTLNAFDAALNTLTQTALRQKRSLLHACGACIVANQRVTAREAELLRAISDSFDVPMPPLLPGQPLA